MRVMLLKEVDHVGGRGELVAVSDGFARNFLLPRKLAVRATDRVEAYARRIKETESKRAAARVAELKVLADRLAGVSCSLPRKAGEDEKLFGSVTAADIAASLASQGFPIDRRKIHLPDPIKSLGVYTVPIRLGSDVGASIKVWVVREAAAK